MVDVHQTVGHQPGVPFQGCSSFLFFTTLSHSFLYFPTLIYCFLLFSSLSSSFLLFPILSYSFLLFPTLSYGFLLFPTLPHSFPLFPTLSHSFLLFPTLSYSLLLFSSLSVDWNFHCNFELFILSVVVLHKVRIGVSVQKDWIWQELCNMPGHECIDDFSRNFRHHKHFSVREIHWKQNSTSFPGLFPWR